MKSEERHRLQENELEKFAAHAGKWFEKHGLKVVAVVCGLIVLGAIIVYVARSMHASAAAGWTELRAAALADQQVGSPKELSSVARKYGDSAIGAWALLQAAEMRLGRFSTVQFSDRPTSDNEIRESAEDFRKVLQNTEAPPAARERALYGRATALEVLSDGDNAEAVETYQRFLQEFPDTLYKPIVERRIAALEGKEASKFYRWFREQDPQPDDFTHGPSDGGAGELPEIPEDLELRVDLEPDASDDEASPGTSPSEGPALRGPSPGGDDSPSDDTSPSPSGETPSSSDESP